MLKLSCVFFQKPPKKKKSFAGKYYVKVGHKDTHRLPLKSQQEVTEWYRHAHSRCGQVDHVLLHILRAHLPGLSANDWSSFGLLVLAHFWG